MNFNAIANETVAINQALEGINSLDLHTANLEEIDTQMENLVTSSGIKDVEAFIEELQLDEASDDEVNTVQDFERAVKSIRALHAQMDFYLPRLKLLQEFQQLAPKKVLQGKGAISSITVKCSNYQQRQNEMLYDVLLTAETLCKELSSCHVAHLHDFVKGVLVKARALNQKIAA